MTLEKSRALLVLNKFLLSAQFPKNVYDKNSGRSLKNRLSNKEPSLEPCGTKIFSEVKAFIYLGRLFQPFK